MSKLFNQMSIQKGLIKLNQLTSNPTLFNNNYKGHLSFNLASKKLFNFDLNI